MRSNNASGEHDGSRFALDRVMRIGIGLVIVGAVVAGIVMDRHREKPAAPPPAVAASVRRPRRLTTPGE